MQRIMQFIDEYCVALEADPIVRRTALDMLRRMTRRERRQGANGKRDPRGMAAGLVYVAFIRCGLRYTKAELARVSGVTETTVRNRDKEIRDKLGLGELLI